MKIAVPVIAAVLLLLKADNLPSVRVLCYHTFRDAKNTYNFTHDELRGQIEFLKSKGFSFISAQDLLAGKIKGDKNVLVTIDDGNVSVYRAYKDILKPYGIRPVLAIYPNIIGKKSYALTWEQLDELMKDGCEIAAHGYYHNILSTKNYEKDQKGFTREIVLSKKILEEKLGRRVNIFIYPFGAHCEEARKIVKDAGYRMAFTIKPGGISFPINGDSYTLPRYMLTQGTIKWQMHAIAGALPKKGKAVDKDSSVLVAKADTDHGKAKDAPAGTAKEKVSQKKGPVVVTDRLHLRKKRKDAPHQDTKAEKLKKKERKRPADKDIAAVTINEEPVKVSGNKQALIIENDGKGELFYPEIGTIAPAGGDALLDDPYVAKEATQSQEGTRAAAMQKLPKVDSGRSQLRKEYLTLAIDSCQSYAGIINRFTVKMQELKNFFLRLTVR